MKNKILMALLSLLISFGLWLYVVTVISPQSETTIYNVAVEVVGADQLDAKDLVLTSETKDLTVDLKLRGNRSDLSKLSSSNITIIADLSHIAKAGEHQIEYTISFQSGTAEVIEQTPQYIAVQVQEQATKTVPVKVNCVGSVKDGYEADKESVTMNHTAVTVKGPKEMVDQIAYAGITVDLSGKMTSFVDDYALTLYGNNYLPLVNVQYVTTNLSQISAMVEVYRAKKISLIYDLDYTGTGWLENEVNVTATKEVTLTGTDTALANLGEQFANDQFRFTIRLADYVKTGTDHLTLPLPDGVSCKDDIYVYIQMPERSSKTLTVKKIRLENEPEGLSVQVVGKVEALVWGEEEVLEKITGDMITAVVDCRDLTEESLSAPVSFLVEGENGVWGQSGTVTVSVMAAKSSDEAAE